MRRTTKRSRILAFILTFAMIFQQAGITTFADEGTSAAAETTVETAAEDAGEGAAAASTEEITAETAAQTTAATEAPAETTAQTAATETPAETADIESESAVQADTDAETVPADAEDTTEAAADAEATTATDAEELIEAVTEDAEASSEEAQTEAVTEVVSEAAETEAETETETETEAEAPKTYFTYSDSRVVITATASEEANLPQDAELKADYLEPDSKEYKVAVAAFNAQLSTELGADDENVVVEYTLYDIYFLCTSTGERIEPEEGYVTVTMTFVEPVAVEAEGEVISTEVVHLKNDGEAEIVTDYVDTNSEGEVTSVGFTQDSFSVGGLALLTASGNETEGNTTDPFANIADAIQVTSSTSDVKSISTSVTTSDGSATSSLEEGKSYTFSIDMLFRQVDSSAVYWVDVSELLPYLNIETSNIPTSADTAAEIGSGGIGTWYLDVSTGRIYFNFSEVSSSGFNVTAGISFSAEIKDLGTDETKEVTIKIAEDEYTFNLYGSESYLTVTKTDSTTDSKYTEGDTVSFTVTVTSVDGTTKVSSLSDAFSMLSAPTSVTVVKTDANGVTSAVACTLSTSGSNFTLTFNPECELAEGEYLTITYTMATDASSGKNSDNTINNSATVNYEDNWDKEQSQGVSWTGTLTLTRPTVEKTLVSTTDETTETETETEIDSQTGDVTTTTTTKTTPGTATWEIEVVGGVDNYLDNYDLEDSWNYANLVLDKTDWSTATVTIKYIDDVGNEQTVTDVTIQDLIDYGVLVEQTSQSYSIDFSKLSALGYTNVTYFYIQYTTTIDTDADNLGYGQSRTVKNTAKIKNDDGDTIGTDYDEVTVTRTDESGLAVEKTHDETIEDADNYTDSYTDENSVIKKITWTATLTVEAGKNYTSLTLWDELDQKWGEDSLSGTLWSWFDISNNIVGGSVVESITINGQEVTDTSNITLTPSSNSNSNRSNSFTLTFNNLSNTDALTIVVTYVSYFDYSYVQEKKQAYTDFVSSIKNTAYWGSDSNNRKEADDTVLGGFVSGLLTKAAYDYDSIDSDNGIVNWYVIVNEEALRSLYYDSASGTWNWPSSAQIVDTFDSNMTLTYIYDNYEDSYIFYRKYTSQAESRPYMVKSSDSIIVGKDKFNSSGNTLTINILQILKDYYDPEDGSTPGTGSLVFVYRTKMIDFDAYVKAGDQEYTNTAQLVFGDGNTYDTYAKVELTPGSNFLKSVGTVTDGKAEFTIKNFGTLVSTVASYKTSYTEAVLVDEFGSKLRYTSDADFSAVYHYGSNTLTITQDSTQDVYYTIDTTNNIIEFHIATSIITDDSYITYTLSVTPAVDGEDTSVSWNNTVYLKGYSNVYSEDSASASNSSSYGSYAQAYFFIEKTYKVGDETGILSGVKFYLYEAEYDSSNNSISIAKDSITNEKIVLDTAISQSDGIAAFVTALEPGSFYAVEEDSSTTPSNLQSTGVKYYYFYLKSKADEVATLLTALQEIGVNTIEIDDTDTSIKAVPVEADVVNEEKQSGSLEVTKTVEADSSTAATVSSDTYSVKVTMTSGTAVALSEVSAVIKGTTTEVTLTNTDNTDTTSEFTFDISGGQTVALSGLPVGTYTVEETKNTGDTFSITYIVGTSTTAVEDAPSVSVSSSSTATVEVVNTYPIEAPIEVQKTYEGTWPTDGFTFRLEALTNSLTGVTTPMPTSGVTKISDTIVQISVTAANDSDKTYSESFSTISYEKDGTYYYKVTEVAPSSATITDETGSSYRYNGIEYTSTVYYVKVVVSTDKTTHERTATVLYSTTVTDDTYDTADDSEYTAVSSANKITFTNKKLGSLTITKAVTNVDVSNFTDTFYFTVSREIGEKIYYYGADGSSTETKTVLSMNYPDDSTLTVSNLAEGEYTVTEVANSNGDAIEEGTNFTYSVTSPTGASTEVTVDADATTPVDAAFTNAKGKLTVTKRLEDEDGNLITSGEKTFTVAIYDGDVFDTTLAPAAQQVGDAVTITVNKDGSGTGTGTAVFTGLDVGTTYYVYELDDNDDPIKLGDSYNGYTVTYSSASVQITSNTLTDGSVTVTNTLEKATLQITKTIAGDIGVSDLSSSEKAAITFSVTGTTASGGTYSETFTYADIVKAGGTMTLSVEPGTYKVTETKAGVSGYTVKTTYQVTANNTAGNTVEAASAEVTLVNKDETVVAFTNTYDKVDEHSETKTKVTVTKSWAYKDSTDTVADEDKQEVSVALYKVTDGDTATATKVGTIKLNSGNSWSESFNEQVASETNTVGTVTTTTTYTYYIVETAASGTEVSWTAGVDNNNSITVNEGTAYKVSSTDAEVSVAVTNTLEKAKATLQITKTISGDLSASDLGSSAQAAIKFSVTGTTASGGTYSKTFTYADIVAEGGTMTLSVEPGTYTVTETSAGVSGYALKTTTYQVTANNTAGNTVEAASAEVTLVNKDETVVAFTNTYDEVDEHSETKTKVTVTKSWAYKNSTDTVADEDKQEVSVTLYKVTDGDTATATKVGTVTLNSGNSWSESFAEQVASETDTVGMTTTTTNYTYYIVESAASGTEVSWTVGVDMADSITVNEGTAYKVSSTDAEVNVVVTNTIEKKIGSLTVSKIVAGSVVDTTKDFTFTVTLSDKTLNGTFGDMTFTDGVATFTLKHGESKTATGLPAGTTYTVTENSYTADGYVTTSTGATGTIVKDEIQTAAFKNTITSVKISKVDVTTEEELPGATIQIVDEDGNVIDEWTSTDQPHEVTGLVPGETYTLVETVAPDGYEVTTNTTFTLDENGDIDTSKTTTTVSDEGVLLVEDSKTSVKISKVDVTTEEELPGATIQILDKDGNVVDEWTSTTEAHEVTGLKTGETYTLHEVVAPAGYDIATDTTFTLNADGTIDTSKTTTTVSDSGVLLVEDSMTKSETAEISVTKKLELSTGDTLIAPDATFYVGLYTDAACTNLYAMKAITFENASASTVTFTNLEIGRTYYIAECDSTGAALDAGIGAMADGTKYAADFGDGETSAKVTVTDGSQTTVTFTNGFYSMPGGFYKEGYLTITKKLLGADGAALTGDAVFYAGIFTDSSCTTLATNVDQNIVTLDLAGGSEVSVTVAVSIESGETVTLYVTETDAEGNPVANDSAFAYTMSVDGAEVSEVSLDETNNTASVTITNQEIEDTSEESSEEEEVETETESEAVQTGDETPLAFYFSLMLMAVAVMLFEAGRRRRRDGSDE